MSTDEYGEKKLLTTPHPCPISPRCPQCPIGPPQNKIPPPCAAPLRLQPVANKRSAVEPPIQKSQWQTSEAQLSQRSRIARKYCGDSSDFCAGVQSTRFLGGSASLSFACRHARKYCGDSSDFCAGVQSTRFPGGSATRAACGKQAKRS